MSTSSGTESSSSLQAQTYYTLLGIEEAAQAGEAGDSVRKAYLRKAAKCHPDKHPEDETATEQFQALGEAYECLKDPDARREYDLKLVQLRQEPIQLNLPHPDFTESSHFFPQPNYAQSQAGSWAHRPSPLPPHAFFRATGFSPLPLFTRTFRHGAGGMPLHAAMEMFADLMATLPGPGSDGMSGMGGMGVRPRMFDMAFGNEPKFPAHLQNPFGSFDPFDHSLFHHPFGPPGPFPPHSHFHHRHRPIPHPSRRHHQPGPYLIPPPAHQALIGPRRPISIAILPQMGGGPIPRSRPVGLPGMPRRHQASFIIKDPVGRPMGVVRHTSMSWSTGMM